jgi:hypothetical protein
MTIIAGSSRGRCDASYEQAVARDLAIVWPTGTQRHRLSVNVMQQSLETASMTLDGVKCKIKSSFVDSDASAGLAESLELWPLS